MKTLSMRFVALILFVISAVAEELPLERSQNFEIRETVLQTEEGGETRSLTNRYVHLEPGINYQESNVWKAASTQIDLAEEGAEFKRGPFKLRFPANHNASPLEWTLPNGNLVKLRTVGLALTHTSGDSLWIAESRDSEGYLEADGSSVVYPNAFSGVKADIVVKVGIGKFENDVVIREQLLDPQSLGWEPSAVKLEIWHEIVEMPAVNAQMGIVRRANGALEQDEQLELGGMLIGQGTAFLVGANQLPIASGDGRLAVAKERFHDADAQATYLIESVPYVEAVAHLSTLPAREQARIDGATIQKKLEGARNIASRGKRQKPASLAEAGTNAKSQTSKKVAAMQRKSTPSLAGYVMDYTGLVSISGQRLRGNVTYYVTSEVNLSGATIIEPGTVVKFSYYTNGLPALKFHGPITCMTTPTAPAIFTADTDNSVGQIIKTNAPSGYYGAYNLMITSANSSAIDLHDIHTRYAANGISISGTNTHHLSNIRVVNCMNALESFNNTTYVHNFLAHNSSNVFAGGTRTVRVEHLTAHTANKLFSVNSGEAASMTLTNSLIVGMSNSSTGVTSVASIALASDTGVFETVKAGAHYLSKGSAYRTYGTGVVSSRMTNLFKTATTYAPLELTNSFSASTVLSPRVPRGNADGAVALGYHYPAADYIWQSLTATNANVTLTNGVAILFYGTNWLNLRGTSQLISQGSPVRMNQIIASSAIQEQPERWITTNTFRLLGEIGTGGIVLHSTEISAMANPETWYLTPSSGFGASQSAFNSLLRNLLWYADASSTSAPVSISLTNNIFERASFTVHQGSSGGAQPGSLSLTLQNNLFRSTPVTLTHYGRSYGYWQITDNLTDNSTLSLTEADPAPPSLGGTVDLVGWNGYTGSSAAFGGVSNKVSLTAEYVNGPLGPYYYDPSGSLMNLIDAGSVTNAGMVGLYHFSSKTNGTYDGGTRLDIGYHYAVVNSNGDLLDSDGDGLSNLAEDVNGNGAVDTGETSFADADTDLDGINDLVELKAGLDPINKSSFTAKQLSSWDFAASTLASDQGDLPILKTNIATTNFFSDLTIGLFTSPAKLQYAEMRANFDDLIVRPRGTVRLWFNPLWSTSSTTNVFASTNLAQLFSMGTSSPNKDNWWSLHFNEKANQLILESEANGVAATNLIASVSLSNTNWYHIALAYETNSVRLFTNGVLAASSATNILYPSYWIRQQSKLLIGSMDNGYGICSGWLDQIGIWNFAQSDNAINADYLNTDLNDPDHDGISSAFERSIGTNPLLADTDGDGIPDRWERDHGFNPTSSSDADHALTNHATTPYQDYIYGLEPSATNNVIPASLADQAQAATNLFNLDFGGDGAYAGRAAAGYSDSDSWLGLTVYDADLSDAAGNSSLAHVTLAYYLGHISRLVNTDCPVPYPESDPFHDVILMTNFFYGFTCTDGITNLTGRSDTIPTNLPPNCVVFSSETEVQTFPENFLNYTVNAPEAWIPDRVTVEEFPAGHSGIALNPMISNYSYSPLRSVLDILPQPTYCNAHIWERDGSSQMKIGPLPGAWYRIYLYGCVPGLRYPTAAKINGRDVTVPPGGCDLPNFVNGANYQKTTVPLQGGYINFNFTSARNILNGIQLMSLWPLTGPTNLNVRFAEEHGVVIRWAPVATALGYEVLRTNLTTHECFSIKQFSGGLVDGPMDPTFTDTRPPREQTIAYFVRAVNEVDALSSPWMLSPSITPPPGDSSSHHAPHLTANSIHLYGGI